MNTPKSLKDNLPIVFVGLGVTLALYIYTALLFPQLPENFPTHYGLNGQPDAWQPKATGAYLTLWIILGLTVMFALLPALSPKTKPIESFRKTYDLIAYATLALTGYIHIISIQGALGTIKVDAAIVLGVLAMLAVLGNVLGRVKPNYFVGVRTPWTLESPLVWEKTHRLAARLTVAGSLLGTLLLLLGVHPLVAVILGISGLLIPAAYSYVLYKQTTPAS